RFVAGFLGDSNFLPGTVREAGNGRCVVDTAPARLTGVAVEQMPPVGSSVVCSIRPHAFHVAGDGPNRIPAHVEEVAFLGELVHVRLVATGKTRLQMVSLPQNVGQLNAGDAVTLSVTAENVVVLPA